MKNHRGFRKHPWKRIIKKKENMQQFMCDTKYVANVMHDNNLVGKQIMLDNKAMRGIIIIYEDSFLPGR